MNLYEAIEVIEKWLTRIKCDDYRIALSADEYEALKICCKEAAREEAHDGPVRSD